jgi:CheY-like chemotaxis protein
MSKPLLLLIDDSAEMGLIVASLGRRADWETVVRVDAEAAWQALAERRPDLVLLDVNLPGASGLDWLRRVRAAPEFAGLVVALYTHWGLPADVAAGLDAGVDFVFDKDLAARPTDWQRRLAEIGEGGRTGKCTGAWPNADCPPTMKQGGRSIPPMETWMAAFRQALRHPLLRRLTREVAPAVLRRALKQALGTEMAPAAFDAWIGPDGFDAQPLPPTFAPASPADLAVCLAEQIERLLGEEAGAAFRSALASVPGVREFLSAP